MGRGRAKAKQTKVARELKYRSFETDFSSLERELRSGSEGHEVPPAYADLVEESETTRTLRAMSGSTGTFASQAKETRPLASRWQ